MNVCGIYLGKLSGAAVVVSPTIDVLYALAWCHIAVVAGDRRYKVFVYNGSTSRCYFDGTDYHIGRHVRLIMSVAKASIAYVHTKSAHSWIGTPRWAAEADDAIGAAIDVVPDEGSSLVHERTPWVPSDWPPQYTKVALLAYAVAIRATPTPAIGALMPTSPSVKYGKHVCTFTIAELAAKGIDGNVHYDEWEPPPLHVEQSTDSHGTALLVTFEHEGAFWQVSVGYCHEDWSANDIADARETATVEATQVEPYTCVRYRPVWTL
jgi:hypothetical protein